MDELHSLDPRRQELLEARFIGAVSGNTGGSTGSASGGAKVMHTHIHVYVLSLYVHELYCNNSYIDPVVCVFFVGLEQ